MDDLSQADINAYKGNHQPMTSGAYLRYYCPIHGSDHQRSLAVRKENGAFFCHSCKAKGFLVEHKQRWLEKNRQEESNNSSLWSSPRSTIRVPPVSMPIEKIPANRIPTMEMLAPQLTQNSIGAQYLQKRGISIETATRLNLGYLRPGQECGSLKTKTRWGSVAFPHHRKSQIINIYLRHIGGKPDAKHYHMPGTKGVFNERALSKEGVHLCEGVFDALTLEEKGIPAAAIFGLTLDWSLVSARRVVLALDLDEPGRKASFELSYQALAFGKEAQILDASHYNGKDLNL